jgi:uncharacterized membrane protein
MPGRKDPGRNEEANAMVKIDITTDVKRPVEEVYTYVADLRNAPQWQSWLQTVQQQGQTRKGIKVHQSGQWMGRKLEFDSEITEYEPDRKFSFTASSPFPYTLSNSFGQHDGGTRIESQLLGEPGGFFKLAEPLVKKMAGQMWRSDYRRLKTLLEAGAATKAESLRG